MNKIAGCLFFLAIIAAGCSQSSETVKTEESNEAYVFDEVPEDETVQYVNPSALEASNEPAAETDLFIVQVGAFKTKEKALLFSESVLSKVDRELAVVYNESLQLYVVQVMPGFKERREAEAVRDELRKIKDFSDAWITR